MVLCEQDIHVKYPKHFGMCHDKHVSINKQKETPPNVAHYACSTWNTKDLFHILP